MKHLQCLNKRIPILLFLLFIFAQGSTAQAAKGDLSIDSIRFGFGDGKTRIVIDLNQKTDFRAFLIGSPARLAVDLPAARWRTTASGFSGEDMIKGYRSGWLEKTRLTRIIFDLRFPAIVADAFTLPKDSMNKDRLVIDLQPASPNMFSAKTAEVYGNPALKGASSAKPASSEIAWARERTLGKIAPPRPSPQPPVETSDKPTKTAKRIVVIDAGHGGQDPGATTGEYREKNITLSVAKELRRQMEETGRYKVVLTRDRDYYIQLRDRMAISRKVKADAFISIHADKVARQKVAGASIYTLSENASDEETERLADDANNAGVVAGVDLKVESHDVADILLDLAMREKMNESNVLAKSVAEALRRKNVRLLPNSHRSAGFAVLKAPDVPAILIETGFISNPNEAKLLDSSAFQSKISSAILDGIDGYFRKMRALEKGG